MPETELEKQIAAVWKDVLELDAIGINDNFFELGGTSLKITELIARLRQTFSREIPLHYLIQNPTIVRVKEFLEKEETASDISQLPSELVPLQPTGNKPPIFLIHPALGVVFPYYELSSLMGEKQPIYGLQSVGIKGGEKPLKTVEEMAARYLKSIKKVQPSEPYKLLGWSFGGAIAYEMALQLQQQGEEVSELILLDAPGFFAGKTKNILPFLKISSVMARGLLPDIFKNFKSSKLGRKLNILKKYLRSSVRKKFLQRILL
jgi:acyl carrier protein